MAHASKTLVINGKPFKVEGAPLPYATIVELAGFDFMQHPNVTYQSPQVSGTLTWADRLTPEDWMVVSVVEV